MAHLGRTGGKDYRTWCCRWVAMAPSWTRPPCPASNQCRCSASTPVVSDFCHTSRPKGPLTPCRASWLGNTWRTLVNMLEVDLRRHGPRGGGLALNEVTVHRRDVASMIRISVHRNGTFRQPLLGGWAHRLHGDRFHSILPELWWPHRPPGEQRHRAQPHCPPQPQRPSARHSRRGTLEIQAEGRDDHLMLTLDTRSHKVPAPARFTRPQGGPALLARGTARRNSSRRCAANSTSDWTAAKGPSNAPTRKPTR